MEFFDGTPFMKATRLRDWIFGQFLQVLFGCCFLVITGVEVHRFGVSSTRLGAFSDCARDGNNEEARKPQRVGVIG